MKKGLKIALTVILGVWAVVATVLLVGAFAVYSESEDEWAEKLAEQNALYKELEVLYLASEEQVSTLQTVLEIGANVNPDLALFDLWGEMAAPLYSACSLCEDTVLVAVYPDGDSFEQVGNNLSEHIPTFRLMLEESAYTTGVLLVMGSDNEVWFGYTFTSDGEYTALLSEKYVE